jgi:uncharacterized membrane protein YhaH (DUF805 family)
MTNAWPARQDSRRMNPSSTTPPEPHAAAAGQVAARAAARSVDRTTDRTSDRTTDRTTPAFVAPPPPLFGLAFAGRIGRIQWLTGVVMLGVALAIVQVVSLKHPDPAWVHGRRLEVGIACVLLLRLSTLRLHDRARSGVWSLALLVPGLNVVALFELALLRGVDETTPEGHAPNDGSLIELTLSAAVLGLFVGLGVLSFHPTHAIDALKPPQSLEALAPYGSNDAKAAFENDYRSAPQPKAYAASGRGAFGWVASSGSTIEAAGRALHACESRRRWTEPVCALLDVNDSDVRDLDVGAAASSTR